ncbi:RNA polymerase sigma factor [Actinomadura rubteroloni]|uniref:RNA polymerase sigma factor n=1 Tax=Actinomadura rubteroloni TaxID=1926885 RepID=A0A2P4URI1_9ACTN|nr:hypothetical protein [Actinomadura rubteroloni]POM27661.1 RNA polymerase sigma factor [Actinomadura rubteroloni]
MSAWPTLDRAADERLARALATGDAAAPGLLADRYGARLYDYSHALLRDRDEASWALYNALLAAGAHGSLAGGGGRLRAWLYALVRHECLLRLRDPDRPDERIEAPEAEDAFLDEAEHARLLEARRLAHSALAALRGRERETLDLLLRHDLDTPEIGVVLGLESADAARLAAVARARLDEAVAAALIARSRGHGCREAAVLADRGGWPVDPATARALVAHLEDCRVCAAHRGRSVSAARLLQALPVAMMPGELPGAITDAAADPGIVAEAARRAGPFGPDGLPLPPDARAEADEPRRGRTPPRLWPALGAAAAVILVVTGGYLLMPGSESPAAGLGTAASTPAADPSESPQDSPSPEPTTSAPTPTTSAPTPSATPTTRRPTPKPTRTKRPKPPARPPVTGAVKVGGGCELTGVTSCVLTVTAPPGTAWTASASGPLRLSRSAGRGNGVVVVSRAVCTDGDEQSYAYSVEFSGGGGVTPVAWSCKPPAAGQ